MANHSTNYPTFENWEYKYSILIKEDNGKIKTLIDDEWNIETNIKWFIVKKVEEIIKPWYIVVEVSSEVYEKLNSWVDNLNDSIRIETQKILEKLYNQNEKQAA